MGITAVKIKIMPSSPEVNIKELKQQIKSVIEKKGGKNCSVDEQPVAFGLKAIIAFFAWPEEKEFESVEQMIQKIEDVSSVQIIDMRRAFG